MSEQFQNSLQNLEISPADRRKAQQYLDSNHVMIIEIETAQSPMAVRDMVFLELDIPTDTNGPERPLSAYEKAVLAEAVGRWNRAHPSEKSPE